MPNVGDNVVTRISFIDYGKILNGNVNMPTYNEFPQNAQGRVVGLIKKLKGLTLNLKVVLKDNFLINIRNS